MCNKISNFLIIFWDTTAKIWEAIPTTSFGMADILSSQGEILYDKNLAL